MDVTTSRKKEDSDEYEDVVENKTLNSQVPLWKRQKKDITKEEYDDIYNTFKAYNFPMTVDKTTIDEVIAASKNDKKMDGNKVKFILLKKVGEAYIDMTVDDNTMRRSLKNVVIE